MSEKSAQRMKPSAVLSAPIVRLLAVAILLIAASRAYSQTDRSDQPMQFFPVSPGLLTAGGVMAFGRIEQDTASRLNLFMVAHLDLVNRTPVVYLLSGGGNVAGGLALGRYIRKAGLRTTVGIPAAIAKQQDLMRYVPNRDTSSILAEITQIYPSQCASSCTLAFLGGVARHVVAGSLFEVHKTYVDDPSILHNRKILPGDWMDLGEEQMAEIADYAADMGIASEFVKYMAKGGHTQQHPILRLDAATLARLAVTTVDHITASSAYPDNQAPTLTVTDQDGDFVYGRMTLSCTPDHKLYVRAFFPRVAYPWTGLGSSTVAVTLYLTDPANGQRKTIPVPGNEFYLERNIGGTLRADILIPPNGVFDAFYHAAGIAISTSGSKIAPPTAPAVDAIGSSVTPIPRSVHTQILELARSC